MNMSDSSPHDELIKNLESAMDMSKFMSVFNSLVAIIKDQQSKIDDLTAKSDRMSLLIGDSAHRPPSAQSDILLSALDSDDSLVRGLAEKVHALETKLNDTLLELHGLGEDNSILDREEQPPEFVSLSDSGKEHPSFGYVISKRFTATAPSIEEHIGYEEEDPSSPMGFSGAASAVASKRSSLSEGTRAGEGDDAEVAAAMEGTQEAATLVSNQPSAITSPVSEAAAAGEGDQPPTPAEGDVPSRVPSRVPSPAMAAHRAESPNSPAPSALPASSSSPTSHHRLHHHHNRTSFRSDCSEDSHAHAFHPPNRMSSVLSAVGNANTRGLLTVTPMEMRPSTMRESFSTKLHQVEHELFPNREDLDTEKYSPKSRAHLKAAFGKDFDEESKDGKHGHLHPRIVPHFLKFHTDTPPPPRERLVALAEYRTLRTRDHGEKMNVANLTLLTDEKRTQLLRKLQQKGRFIRISRDMLEDSRQKYAARSLKQNVEFVEAETRRLFNKVAGIKDTLKRQHAALRYLLPADFHETYDRLVDLLEQLELKGGIEELMALPRANRIVAYEEDGGVPKGLLEAIVAMVRPIVLQEVNGVRTQLQSLKDEALTSAQLAEIMLPEDGAEGGRGSRGGSGANNSDPFAKEKELVRRRTMNLVKECVEERLARERDIAAAEEAGKVTVGTVLQQEVAMPAAGHASSGPPRPKSQSMILIQNQTIDAANRQYVDDKLRTFEEQLTALRLSVDSNKDNSCNDLAFITAKLETLEAATSQIQQYDLETREQRRKDSEALKIMQKRLANVSIDNVMDELKVLQLQVNDRPSTSDVGNMMESISHTFRKHLGENVVGLRGLVDQVYRQIHHKVNREDIKKLISAKLAQMEADILRREEEMFSMASSVRCMSCGQLPPDPTNAFAGHTGARRVAAGAGTGTGTRAQHQHHPHPHHHQLQIAGDSVTALTTGASSVATASGAAGAGVSVTSSSHGGRTGMLRPAHRPSTSPSVAEDQEYPPFNPSDPSSSALLFNPDEAASGHAGGEGFEASQQAGSQMDDDISLHSEHSGNNPSQSLQLLSPQSSSMLGPVRSEEIYNVITGTAGLKSLMPQHTPLIPVRDPYGTTTSHHQRSGAAPATKALKRVEKVPEPLYRKAKMAAHLKEMVKVTAPSVQNYGHSANNPFFVLDGFAADDAEAQQLAQLEGGAALHSHRSGAAGGGGGAPRSRPRTQGSVGQQVYVPIPRSSLHPQASSTQHMLMSASHNTGLGSGLGIDGSGRSDHSVSSVLPYIHAKQAIH